MVIVHLQCEGYALHLADQAALPVRPRSHDVTANLGELLWGFCQRFGHALDYTRQAVSVMQARPEIASYINFKISWKEPW